MQSKDGLPNMHANASPKTFQMAERLRRNMTVPEKRLWEFLRLKPEGYKFRRQHPFDRYVLDFYCHKKRLSIEVDGESHSHKKQIEMDQYRTDVLEEFGILEIRFINSQVMDDFESVIKSITMHLRDGSL